jgi:competence protein ComGC
MKQKKGFTVVELIVICIVVIVAALVFANCKKNEGNKTDELQAQQTERLMIEANNQIGMPNIKNFQQKKLMKMIYELCDKENLVCYAYIKSDYQGKLFCIGKCIGYGIPFSAQYTNPQKFVEGDLGERYGDIPMPQADPNGLYMPVTSSATWLMMVDPKTKKPRPVYIEPEIVVSPFPLHVQ